VGGSQFWKGILRTRGILKWDCRAEMNHGKNNLFWEDVWAGGIPMKLEFPSLYNICEDKSCLVNDYWEGDGWNVRFRRGVGGMKRMDGRD